MVHKDYLTNQHIFVSLHMVPAYLCTFVCTVFRCECGPGYMGEFCGRVCVPGRYGANCALTCTCEGGVPCDRVTGQCPCPPGFTGLTCDKGKSLTGLCNKHSCSLTKVGKVCNSLHTQISYNTAQYRTESCYDQSLDFMPVD